VIGALIVAVIVWRVVVNLVGSGVPPAAAPVPVTVAPVRQGTFVVWQSAPGTVVPVNSVLVKSRVEGRLTRIAFKDGQPVKKGDLLATLDARQYQAQLDLASGQLASDTAALANAKATLARFQTLLGEQSIERQRVDDQAAKVAQYAAAVKADQGRADLARLQLADTSIRAPISGMAGLREVAPDNLVSPSDPRGIVRITQLQPTSVVFALPADGLAPVMASFEAHANIPVVAYGSDPADVLGHGHLQGINNQVDPSTGTVKLKAEFPNAQRALFPNQAVSVRLPTQTLPAALQVPSAAIQHGADGPFVYVVDAHDTVAATAVKLGPDDGTTCVVTSGLAAGARVVVAGADNLRDGAKVAPRAAAHAQPGTTDQPAASA
jgi:multidrug efflux system membrane fusion protein